jgi:hypothetical protein
MPVWRDLEVARAVFNGSWAETWYAGTATKLTLVPTESELISGLHAVS